MDNKYTFASKALFALLERCVSWRPSIQHSLFPMCCAVRVLEFETSSAIYSPFLANWLPFPGLLHYTGSSSITACTTEEKERLCFYSFYERCFYERSVGTRISRHYMELHCKEGLFCQNFLTTTSRAKHPYAGHPVLLRLCLCKNALLAGTKKTERTPSANRLSRAPHKQRTLH